MWTNAHDLVIQLIRIEMNLQLTAPNQLASFTYVLLRGRVQKTVLW